MSPEINNNHFITWAVSRVLEALRRASAGRTVLSVSHRVYENLGGRTIEIRTRE